MAISKELNGLMRNFNILAVEQTLIVLTIYKLIGKSVGVKIKIKVSIILPLKLTLIVQLDDVNVLIEHLQYDGTYRVAVCDKCKHALPKEWIKGPFKDIHQVLVYNSFFLYS